MSIYPNYRLVRDGAFRRLDAVSFSESPSQFIRNSDDIRPLVRERSADYAVEQAGALYLDRHNRIIGAVTLSSGDAGRVHLSPSLVLMPAMLLAECTAVITEHNHLSDPAAPSEADLEAFEQLRRGLDGYLHLLDNVIASPGDFFSFRDAGYFNRSADIVVAFDRQGAGSRSPIGDCLPRRTSQSLYVTPRL